MFSTTSIVLEILYVVKCSLCSLHSRRHRDGEDKMFGQEGKKRIKILPSDSENPSIVMQIVALIWQDFFLWIRNNKEYYSEVTVYVFHSLKVGLILDKNRNKA